MQTLETLSSSALNDIADIDAQYVMGVFARQPVLFVRGQGVRLWDSDGNEYLDFLSGLAVAGVGHCHPRVTRAIAEQAGKLIHVSNLFHNSLQARLAQRLAALTHMERTFFCNSGAEAIEGAIKIARKWGKQNKSADAVEIITLTGSFHGRTLAAVTATAQPKYQEAFVPLPLGFTYVPRWDIVALRAAVGPQTCAIMFEPVQGESGVHCAPPGYISEVRRLCDEQNILMILDEVQSGMGRTGRFLACQHAEVLPDVVTLAKSLASGVPIGAILARGTAASTLVPGDHGSTFGGQPLACAAALATLDVLEDENLMQNAETVGAAFLADLRGLEARCPGQIAAVRGMGLMAAVDLTQPIAKAVALNLLDRRLVTYPVGDSTLRFLPPLVVNAHQCRQAADRVAAAILEVSGGK